MIDYKNVIKSPKSTVAAVVILTTLALMTFKVITTEQLIAIWGGLAALIGFFKNDTDLTIKP